MDEIPPVDMMEMLSRAAGRTREEFALEFNTFMNGPASLRCYVFKGPDWMAFCQHIDPGTHPEAPGDAWLIHYFFDRSGQRGYRNLFRCIDAGLGPQLPYVAFMRPLRGRKALQFFKWERIRRLCDASSPLLSGS
jgi:hypothetical protein